MGTRAVLMWQHRHVSTHQPANWTGTNPHESLRGAMAKWAEWIGPTGIVGPVSRIVKGGLYDATRKLVRLSPYIGNNLLLSLSCGTKCFCMCAGDVATRGELD